MKHLVKHIFFFVLVAGMLVTGTKPALGQELVTVAGNPNANGAGNGGPATAAVLEQPVAGTVDDSGNLYITDYYANVVRKVYRSTGVIITVAGCGQSGFSGDNGPAVEARLAGPSGLAIDGEGNMYISDHYNNRIRKVNKEGVISTVVGTGVYDYTGNGGPAIRATLRGPAGIVFDKQGNLLIADCENNCIRKVSHTGVISTIVGDAYGAGTGGGSCWGDGGLAVKAQLSHPVSIALDGEGNLYISDCFNHRIRKVDGRSMITTVCGASDAGYNGDAIAAKAALLNYPKGVAVDLHGGLYVCDGANSRVRYINNKGVIATIAGDGQAGYNGESYTATASQLRDPSFVVLDHSGNVYIGDKGNGRVRRMSQVNQMAGSGSTVVRPPNAVQNSSSSR